MLKIKFFLFSSILLASVLMEVGALYFQYVLDYGPCILCVQIRALVFTIGLISLFGLLFYKKKMVTQVTSALMSLAGAYFILLCYRVLGIERGWFEGSCSFSAPFPEWFPLHEWMPYVFEAWELCGYTPEVFLGVTMAEILMLISISIFSVSAFLVFKRDGKKAAL